MLEGLRFLAGRIAISVLADDAGNAREIWDAGAGSVLPAIAAARHREEAGFVHAVTGSLSSIPLISAALGGGADVRQWHKVLSAGLAGAQHLNQPFSSAGYVKGACPEAWVNGVLTPTSGASRVLMVTLRGNGVDIGLAAAAQLAREAQLDAVKFHPAAPDQHLEATLEVARATADAGVPGFEPAGGLDLESTSRMLVRLMEIPRLLLIPHVFGAVRDAGGRTDPRLVERLVNSVRAAVA